MKKGGSGWVLPRKSRSDGSRNAHASKTTKRGAAGFGVVFPAMKTWASPRCEQSQPTAKWAALYIACKPH